MPLYEFSCKKCKDKFEELVRDSSVKVICPECGSKEVSKLISISTPVFVGTGWYKDGYSSTKK